MSDELIIQKIKDVLEQIRPNLQMDGGDIEFVSFDDGVVQVRFHGVCKSCPASTFTFRSLAEEHLKDSISEVREVILVN
jgi:Fe-S cluster biogenesis protein NfuA